MDIQLQELIDKIKLDGVASAEEEAAKIVSEAEKSAQEILKEAEKKAAASLEKAKIEAERLEKASIDAISQASRNVLLSFRENVVKELNALLKTQTSQALSADLLKTLIPDLIKNWAANENAKDASVLLSKKDLDSLQGSLTASLKAELEKGLSLKMSEEVTDGFRLSLKNGEAFYDFSSESIASLFSAYLNPQTAKIMKEASQTAGN